MSRIIEFEMKQKKRQQYKLLWELGNKVNDLALKLKIITAEQWEENNKTQERIFNEKIKSI